MRTVSSRSPLALLAGALVLVPPVLAVTRADGGDGGDHDHGSVCERSAAALRRAGESEARAESSIGLVDCLNLTDRDEARQCFRDNQQALDEALDLVRAQYAARLDLCDALGGDAYDPQIDPGDFVRDVTNPYFPLVPGTTTVFEGDTADGFEHDEVLVTHDRKTILGVSCVEVHDVVSLDGEVIEDTLDDYAQDRWGNVWYFGELSLSYENGLIVSLEGSWQAGEDGARPGIVMEALPRRGDTYRQEFQGTVAEDAATVTGLGRSVHVPAGSFTDCLETLDFTPLQPDGFEAKFYAPGVGVVLEVDLTTGERTELVDVH